jgi:hypothetical protein
MAVLVKALDADAWFLPNRTAILSVEKSGVKIRKASITFYF